MLMVVIILCHVTSTSWSLCDFLVVFCDQVCISLSVHINKISEHESDFVIGYGPKDVEVVFQEYLSGKA